MLRLWTLFLPLLWAVRAFALGPHELLVLANESSPDSVLVAKEFMRLRQVPDANLVLLAIPPSLSRPTAVLSPEAFTRHVWTPATGAARQRGIDGHILAWVFSTDFPVRIGTDPEISIQGLTFLRNTLPDALDVRFGRYASALFAGPARSGGHAHYPQSLGRFKEWLGEEMPLPSMMLGVRGEGGNSVKEILSCLRRGADSDGTFPKGSVYLVRTQDVRSKCREWQFNATRRALQEYSVQAQIVEGYPTRKKDVIGLMMGEPVVQPSRNRYLSGCIAEHLTSASAVFGPSRQTRLTEWIRAGATGSAGAVTEPYAIWSKFASSHVFVHYASGCTLLESFYQAVRCPLQLLVVGDPLAAPWAPKTELSLRGVASPPVVDGTLSLACEVQAGGARHYGRFVYLLDGRPLGEGRTFDWDTRDTPNGIHRLRAVGYQTGLVRPQAFEEIELMVHN